MNLPTAEGLARVRRTRPLANLGVPGFGKATPTARVSPPPGIVEHVFWVPGPVDGRSGFATASSAFEARKLVSVELGVEPGALVAGGRS